MCTLDIASLDIASFDIASDDMASLATLPDELLGLVATALNDPQADTQNVCRLAAASKALQQRVCGNATVVAELQAARAMLTAQRLHALKVAAKKLGEDAPFPFEPSKYKQLAQQLPTPVTQLDLCSSSWRVADDEARGRAVARLLRVSGSLVKLRLSGNNIGYEGAKALAAGVAACGSLEELWMSTNKIGDEGAQAIAEAIGASGSLTMLDLSINLIGDEGAKALADALRASGSLAQLYLHDNKFGDEGVKALAAGVAASGSLEELWMSTNKIGDKGAKALAAGVAASGSLAKLRLHNNDHHVPFIDHLGHLAVIIITTITIILIGVGIIAVSLTSSISATRPRRPWLIDIGKEAAKAMAMALSFAVAACGSLVFKKLVVPDRLWTHAGLVAACKSKGVWLS